MLCICISTPLISQELKAKENSFWCPNVCISNAKNNVDFVLSSFREPGLKIQKTYFYNDFIDILIFCFDLK